MRRALAIGPVIGAAIAGAFMYLPTHNIGTSFGASLLVIILIGGLRALDPVLGWLWRPLARIPPWIRWVGAVLVPVLFSISRFGPGAAGHEVPRARFALLGSAVIAYLLLRPRAEATVK